MLVGLPDLSQGSSPQPGLRAVQNNLQEPEPARCEEETPSQRGLFQAGAGPGEEEDGAAGSGQLVSLQELGFTGNLNLT